MDLIEIKKIRKQGDQKIITIPKKSNFELGDYVIIKKIDDLFSRAKEGKLQVSDLEKYDLNDLKNKEIVENVR